MRLTIGTYSLFANRHGDQFAVGIEVGDSGHAIPLDEHQFTNFCLAGLSLAAGRPQAEVDAKFDETMRQLALVTPINEAAAATDAAMPIMVARRPTGFRFGPASRKELMGVEPRLVNVATLALEYYTKQDFCCYDGIRTLKEQQEYMQRGTTRTMKSKHLEGLAVDLVPWINGKPVWDWPGCFEIAAAMHKAAMELGVAERIVWGGAWDRRLSDFEDSTSFEGAVAEYRQRHAGKDFIDGPHFEWHND